MLRLRITYSDPLELQAALENEMARGVILVKVTPPESIEFRDPVELEVTSGGAVVALESEVVSILPGVGVAVTFPPARSAEVRALDASGAGPARHEIVVDAPPPPPTSVRPGPSVEKVSTAEKIRLALHGTRDDRSAILRDQNRSLHAFVLKSAQVTQEEVVAWAKNPQMSVELLKQIGDRKDWLARPAVAQGLARNPKTPPELALRALDHVGGEALKQMARGAGVPAHVAAAARKRMMKK